MEKSTMKIENGAQVWRLPNGDLHREDGPAYIRKNYQIWYKNGKIHRIDGPALIMGNHKEWYINGEEIEDQLQYWYLVSKLNLEND